MVELFFLHVYVHGAVGGHDRPHLIVVLAGEVFLEPPAKIRIGNCPTREYLGLIFVYFGEGEAPPFPRYLHKEG
ncbi:MAG: hypothetical protein ACXW6J_08620, partial [Candidatus Binatia bacterium]